MTIQRRHSLIVAFAACLTVQVAQADVLTFLTDGAWAAYAKARSVVELTGVTVGGVATADAVLANQAWVLDYAKVPGLNADVQHDSTGTNRQLNETAQRSNQLGIATAVSNANTRGVTSTAIDDTWLATSRAVAGVGTAYQYRGNGLARSVAVKITEMLLDPPDLFPAPPETPSAPAMTGAGTAVAQHLEVDLKKPGATDWTEIASALVTLSWNGAAGKWDLTVVDASHQFYSDGRDFAETHAPECFPTPDGSATCGAATSFSLITAKDFAAAFYPTDDLTSSGLPWAVGDQYSVQVKMETEGVSSIPEPASVALLLGAIFGLSIRQWDRRRRPA